MQEHYRVAAIGPIRWDGLVGYVEGLNNNE